MSQIRLSIVLEAQKARHLFQLMESEFEEDGYPIALAEEPEDSKQYELSLYVEDDADKALQRIRKLLISQNLPATVKRETLPDIDWVAHSLKGLSPVRAGRYVIHGAHDRHSVRIGEYGIEIDANQAFGTGHHGTTAGCLDMLTGLMNREKSSNALDMGTGSAVLALAIARHLRIPVLASDIDPVATRIAQSNVRLNGASRWVRVITAPGFHHNAFAAAAPFELIVANILARPLAALAPGMANHLARNGSLIVSGILASQRSSVLAAYTGQSFRHIRTTKRGDWITMHLKR